MIYMLTIILVSLAGTTLIYTWIVFPFCILLQYHKQVHKPSPPSPDLHTNQHVSILIAAWNEADVIEQRITNLAALQYPAAHMSIYIGTDGCTDNTAALARTCARNIAMHNLTVCEYKQNRGKASVLKDLATRAIQEHTTTGTVFIFTDANTFFKNNAIQCLVHHLSDPNVGGVCGRLIFDQHQEQPEQSYWTWETKLKEIEAHHDSCLGANGAIYAIRASCFWFDLPTQTIIDDFVIGMKVREAGFRMVFEPQAIAYEDLPNIKDEWHRRVRIGSGAFQALIWCRACLLPRYGYFAIFFWSHKVLRWFTPHIYILMLVTATFALLQKPSMPGRSVFIPYSVFISTLLIASLVTIHRLKVFQPISLWNRAAAACDHFVVMQAALFTGFIRFCCGNVSGKWQRTPRNVNTIKQDDKNQA